MANISNKINCLYLSDKDYDNGKLPENICNSTTLNTLHLPDVRTGERFQNLRQGWRKIQYYRGVVEHFRTGDKNQKQHLKAGCGEIQYLLWL